MPAYLRMPKGTHNLLTETSQQLGLPLAQVANAIFHFALTPSSFQTGWSQRVSELREIIRLIGDRGVLLRDFTYDEWDERRRTYEWLERMGLIEELAWKRSINYSRRVICSFRVSDTGRVIAEVFKGAGFTEDPDDIALLDEDIEMNA